MVAYVEEIHLVREEWKWFGPKSVSEALPTCAETIDETMRCVTVFFSRLAVSGTQIVLIGMQTEDSRANGNQLFRRERVGPWHWLFDCLCLGPKRGDLARWSNTTMTVRWPYRDIVSTRQAISDVLALRIISALRNISPSLQHLSEVRFVS